MKRFSKKERLILKRKDNRDYPRCDLEYVYFLIIRGRIIYIGRTNQIDKRISCHFCNGGALYEYEQATVRVIGPMWAPLSRALEADQINKHKPLKNKRIPLWHLQSPLAEKEKKNQIRSKSYLRILQMQRGRGYSKNITVLPKPFVVRYFQNVNNIIPRIL
jgi:hypothetical protein